MKAVLISIRPQWCELIARGKKTVEVRKTRPKLAPPFKCYIYMTSGDASIPDGKGMVGHHSGGQCVIGEFVCNLITALKADNMVQAYYNNTQNTCLSDLELKQYANNGKLYYWHISDLVIYDRPKELSEFYKNGTLSNEVYCETAFDGKRSYADYLFTRAMRKPPQSWCYVEQTEGQA